MASDCRAWKHCPQTIPYNLAMLCCDFLFLFLHYFWSSVNKLDSDSFSYVFSLSELVKPYSFMTFVNVGDSITGIETVLINFTRSAGCLKFSITWVIISSLKLMNWNLYLLSVGDINTFKISSAPIKLLLWCLIDCWLSPMFFWFRTLVWHRFSIFPWMESPPLWFTFTWSFSPWVVV